MDCSQQAMLLLPAGRRCSIELGDLPALHKIAPQLTSLLLPLPFLVVDRQSNGSQPTTQSLSQGTWLQGGEGEEQADADEAHHMHPQPAQLCCCSSTPHPLDDAASHPFADPVLKSQSDAWLAQGRGAFTAKQLGALSALSHLRCLKVGWVPGGEAGEWRQMGAATGRGVAAGAPVCWQPMGKGEGVRPETCIKQTLLWVGVRFAFSGRANEGQCQCHQVMHHLRTRHPRASSPCPIATDCNTSPCLTPPPHFARWACGQVWTIHT